jgi:hypothetical protein
LGRRLVFQLGYQEAAAALEVARRCRIPAFVDLQRRIVKHRAMILAAIKHDLSQAPRPPALNWGQARTRTWSIDSGIGYLERDCSPLEMLGYHQPRDSHVHG